MFAGDILQGVGVPFELGSSENGAAPKTAKEKTVKLELTLF